MILKKFDIVLVEFPFTNLRDIKKRPALILNPLEGENVILAQITTKRRNMQKYEIYLPKKACKGNIRFDSFVYVDMIFTLHKGIIYGKIGELNDSQAKEEVDRKTKLLFQ